MRDFVRWGASRFNEAGLCFGHGTDNALDEAAALMLHSVRLSPMVPEAYWDTRLTGAEAEHYCALVGRRIDERLPLPYLTGEAWFCGLPFHVDQRVLVPRSPLAEPIETGFEPWLEPGEVRRVLDVGTGSGCIAVACALAFEDALVDATDLSADALELARSNVVRHGLTERVRLYRADVFDGLPDELRYDLIISNPPYVDATDMANLPPEYRHEPRAALAAGDDGLDVVRRILAGAAERLTANGILVVEVGNSAPAVAEAWPGLPAVWLEFRHGGHGVFLLTAGDLRAGLPGLDGSD